MMVLKHFNLLSSPPPELVGKKGHGGREPVQRWFFGADPICVVGEPAVPFAGQLDPLTDTLRTHQQCWGRNSQASAESSQQEGPGPTGTPEVLCCSSLSEDSRPASSMEAHEPLCLSPTCPSQVCLSKMAFHVCPSKTPSNTTDFPKDP